MQLFVYLAAIQEKSIKLQQQKGNEICAAVKTYFSSSLCLITVENHAWVVPSFINYNY